MKQVLWLTACASAAAQIAGCGGGGGDVPLEELGTELGAAQCPKLFECCSQAELSEEFGGFSPPIEDQQDCQDFYAGTVQAFLVPQIRDSVDKGRAIYHADRAGECLDKIAAMTCAEFAEANTGEGFPCENPVEPLVENGDACGAHDECISGYCKDFTRDPEGNVEDGTCAEPPGEGEPCDSTCAEGYECESDGMQGFVCEPKRPVGQSCDHDDQCKTDRCGDDGMCAAPACTGA